MTPPSRSFLITDLSWVEVKAQLAHDRRLLVPVGVCDQFGPHLPLGSGTRIAEAVARELSQDFGVLRAPVLPYGVTVPSENPLAGVAGVREKTLHRVLNDLLASWQDDGFEEFILLTAHSYDPHVEALATVAPAAVRVRVIDVLGIDFSDLLESPPQAQHGGEVVTSLMLYLDPDKVNLERAQDYLPEAPGGGPPRPRVRRIPAESPGSLGRPSLATAEKGKRIYQRIVQKIRSRVFLETDEAERL